MTNISDFAAGLLRRAGETIFRANDEFARNHGWQVDKGMLGLSRTYRHPAFNQLTECLRCSGSGRFEDADCGPCRGTGRVTLSDPARAKKVRS